MSLDANIILRGRGVDTGEMFDSAQKGMNLRQLMNQAQQQEAAQAEQAQLQQAVRQNVVMGPDGQKSINHQAVSQQMMGVNPLAAQKYEREQRAAKLAELKSDVETKNMLFGAATVETWPQLLEQSRKLGLSGADKLPATITQPELDKMKMQGLDYAKQIDYAYKKERLGFDKAKQYQDAQIEREKLNAIKDEKEAALTVPGYERTGEVKPAPAEAQKFRKATATSEQLLSKLNRMQQLVKDKGSFEYGGNAGQEMESLATEIMLIGKSPELYELGVLTGPDLGLLEKITSDPSSIKSLFTRDSTRKTQLETQIKSIKQKLESTSKSLGYKAKSEATSLTIGHEEDGHIYIGGDPAKQSSWKPK
jgi:hypothetical protein